MNTPAEAQHMALAAVLHLGVVMHKDDLGMWYKVNVGLGVVALVWWFSKSTFGYVPWNVTYLGSCCAMLSHLITHGTAAAPCLLTTLVFGYFTRKWRNATFTTRLADSVNMKTEYGSFLNRLLYGNRPLQAIPNHGRELDGVEVKPPKKLVVILNPAAGRGAAEHAWKEAAVVFDDYKIKVTLLRTTRPGEGGTLIEQYSDSVDAFVAVGGDGTLSEALNGMMKRKPEDRYPLGCIPGGTCNNFCYDLGLRSATDAATRIAMGSVAHMDAGKVVHNGTVTYGLNTVAWGVGLKAVQFADRLGFLGAAKFDVGGLLAILTFKPTTVTCKMVKNGMEVVAKNQYVIAMSQMCQRAGNGFRFGPSAKLDDGLLDTCLLKQISVMRTLELFDEVKREGSHLYAYDVDYFQYSEMTFETEEETPMSVDGEDSGTTPMTVTCMRGCFQVYV